jgi:hypothetical protein
MTVYRIVVAFANIWYNGSTLKNKAPRGTMSLGVLLFIGCLTNLLIRPILGYAKLANKEINMAWEYTVTLLGSNGKPVNVNYKLREALYADAVTSASAILTALQAVTAATISKTRLSEVTEISQTLPSGVDTAIVATMSGKIQSTTKPVVIKFPAPKDSIRLGTSGDEYNELDLTASDPADVYWDLFTSTGEAYCSDGEDASNLGPRASQIVSRASRNP